MQSMHLHSKSVDPHTPSAEQQGLAEFGSHWWYLGLEDGTLPKMGLELPQRPEPLVNVLYSRGEKRRFFFLVPLISFMESFSFHFIRKVF